MKNPILLLALSSSLAMMLPAQQPCMAEFDTPTVLLGNSTGGPNLLIGIKLVNGASPLVVLAAQVFTGLRAGTNTLGIWTHDAQNNRPGVDRGTGNWLNQLPNSWQGANLAQPVILQPNEDFWLVWGPQNGQQTSIEANNRLTGQSYRGSFDGGQNWSGPFINYDWKYRLWCVPLPPRAEFEIYGTSCPGSGRTSPRMGSSGTPTLGQQFSVLLSGTNAMAPCTVFIGASNQSWGGIIPLPFDLAPLGAPGCLVQADLLVGVPLMTDASGAASLNLTVSSNPTFVGINLYAQWVVVDAPANTLQLVTSAGGRMKFGY